MADFQARLDKFLRPTGTLPPPRIRQPVFFLPTWVLLKEEGGMERLKQEKLYEEACYFRDKDEGKCWFSVAQISKYLDDEHASDNKQDRKSHAWILWLTARCLLLTAVLEARYSPESKFMPKNKLREELGYYGDSAKAAKQLFRENLGPEWKRMDDASQLCGEMRLRMIAQMQDKASSKT
ncbi:MAG: hypothetical protein Q9221_006238 [Calogaya cf. arnoldii]